MKSERRDLFGKESIYYHDGQNAKRYALGVLSSRNVLFIGVNPNTANDQVHDMTTRKIIKFGIKNGYEGWLLANLYPTRSLSPHDLPETYDNDLRSLNQTIITALTQRFSIQHICCCWGNAIKIRPYLYESLQALVQSQTNSTFLKLGSLTKEGHPKHPSRIGYDNSMESFDVDEYLQHHLSRPV